MVTNMISQLQESFPLYYSLLLSLFLLYNFISKFHNIFVTDILPQVTTLLHFFAVSKMNLKKGCVLCRNFISIYKINRTLHGRLRLQILSLSAESISHSFASPTRERYFQYSKIKFVFPCGHVISSIFCFSYVTVYIMYIYSSKGLCIIGVERKSFLQLAIRAS